MCDCQSDEIIGYNLMSDIADDFLAVYDWRPKIIITDNGVDFEREGLTPYQIHEFSEWTIKYFNAIQRNSEKAARSGGFCDDTVSGDW